MKAVHRAFVAFLKDKIDIADLYAIIKKRIADLNKELSEERYFNWHCKQECNKRTKTHGRNRSANGNEAGGYRKT